MKKYILALTLLLSLSTQAQTIITATVTATNTAGTVNGNNIVVNGTTRTFTNNVTLSASQIANGSNIVSTATNLFLAYVIKREAGMDISALSTNAVIFHSFPGFALTVTLGGSWGTVTFSTNTLVSSTVVRVPMSVAGNYERTNVESGLVEYLNDNKATNAIAVSAPAFSNFVAYYAALTNANHFTKSTILGQTDSNSIALFIRELPNSGTNIIELQDASSNIVFLVDAQGSVITPTLLVAPIIVSTNIAQFLHAYGGDFFGTNQVGGGFVYALTNMICKGPFSADTGVFTNGLQVIGLQTNLNTTGTNILAGIIQFPRFNVTSLANGGNAAIPIGTNSNVFISGPSAAFSVDGIAGGVNGRVVTLTSRVGQTWSMQNESGGDSTPANRIQNGLGGTNVVTLTGNPTWASFSYDSTASRWILMAHGN